jgi:hypothetical protein
MRAGIFAPRVAVTLSRQRIHLGDSIDIELAIHRAALSIENLRVFVKAARSHLSAPVNTATNGTDRTCRHALK